MQEDVCLQLLNVESDGKVELSLYNADNIVDGSAVVSMEVDHVANDDTIHCNEMGLPEDFNKTYAVVGVKAHFPEDDYK